MPFDNTSTVLLITNVITLISAIGGIIFYSLKGGNKASNDVIDIFKLRDVEQKATIKEYQDKFESIKLEVGKLQGALTEKDKKLEEYIAIFQGRNPQMEEFIRKMTDSVIEAKETQKTANGYMVKSQEILIQIKAFMTRMDDKLKSQEHFNKEVSDAIKKNHGIDLLSHDKKKVS